MTGYVIGPDNQILSDGTYNYTYDAEGNTLTKTDVATGDTWTYGYSPENQLTSAVETDAQGDVEVAATYKYDVFGNRIEQDTWTPQNGLQVQKYMLDGWNPAKPAPVEEMQREKMQRCYVRGRHSLGNGVIQGFFRRLYEDACYGDAKKKVKVS